MTDTTDTESVVSITVDGRTVEARPGELVIDACERADVYVPRFCYHPRMRPVGMCRQCLVEIDTGRGPALQPSCMIPVADGMTVLTESPVSIKAQTGVLEFLLVNHPLDCPVCDKGGECPLQDQAMSHGPGESRMVEEKRHFEKPIPISDLVLLDRERCILCDRCTRFAKEVAGDPLIHFQDRAGTTQVNTFPDHPFASYFSGNTVQICPVGALTSTDYRFRARPWDLAQVESTCQGCAVGCRIVVDTSRDRVLRHQGVDIDPVNWGWLCDKGQFGHGALESPERVTQPLVRTGEGERDDLATTTWSVALSRAADALADTIDVNGPASVAVLGGARLTNEDAYAWAKLAKGVIGTDHVDAQMGDGLPADVVLGLPGATIDEVCRPGGTILWVGPDPKEEAAVLYLRVRHAVITDGARLVEIGPASTSLTDLATASIRTRPGELATAVAAVVDGSAGPEGGDAEVLETARALVSEGHVSVVLGRQSLAESAAFTVDAASVISRALPDAKVLPLLRRANVRGALEMGLAPGVLPGRAALDGGSNQAVAAWGSVPAESGLDATGILLAAAEGRIETLVLLGADPLSDYPDRELATRALAGAGTVIACDMFLNESSKRAHVVFPVAAYDERPGTVTNFEGRVSAVGHAVTAPGSSRQDWMIAAELAYRLEGDLHLESVADIQAEITAVAPSFAGVTAELLARSRDGVVVPLAGAVPPDTEVGADGSALGGSDIDPAHGDLADSADESADAAGAATTQADADEESQDAASAKAAEDADDGTAPRPGDSGGEGDVADGDSAEAPAGADEDDESRIGEADGGGAGANVTAPAGADEDDESRIGEAGGGGAGANVTAPAGADEDDESRIGEADGGGAGANVTAPAGADEDDESRIGEAGGGGAGASVTAPSEQESGTPPAAEGKARTVTFVPPPPTEAPAIDAYALRLVVRRRLYDRGAILQADPTMANLAGDSALRAHPTVLDRLGIDSGTRVRAISARASITLPLIADDGVARGVVEAPHQHAGPSASELVDSALTVTDVRLETTGPHPEVPSPAAPAVADEDAVADDANLAEDVTLALEGDDAVEVDAGADATDRDVGEDEA